MLFNFKAGMFSEIQTRITTYVATAASFEEVVTELITITDARPHFHWTESAVMYTPNGRWVIELLFWPEDYERAIKAKPDFNGEIAGSEFVFYVGETPLIAEWFSK